MGHAVDVLRQTKLDFEVEGDNMYIHIRHLHGDRDGDYMYRVALIKEPSQVV